MTESGHEKGINKGRKLEGGKSYAGALARGDVYGGASSKEDNYAYAKEKHRETLHEMKSMPKPKLMAEGGEMSKRDRAMAAFIGSYQKPGNPEVDGDLMPEAHLKEELAEHIHHEPTHDSHVDHDVMNQMGEEDEGAGDMDEIHPMVMKIMMGRAKGYSEGGKVANEESGESSDEPTMAKWDGNEFDDLALDDDLEFNSTGDNAGDHLGDAAEDHDREDIVSRVMRSRSKRDRMAVPGEGSTYGKRK